MIFLNGIYRFKIVNFIFFNFIRSIKIRIDNTMQKKSIVLTFILFELIFCHLSFFHLNFVKGREQVSINSEYPGITHYNVIQNVTYEITLNWTLTRLGTNSYTFYLKNSFFDNRIPSEYVFTPPIQVSSLETHSIEGNGTEIITQTDKFGNHYYLFNRTINNMNSAPISINQKYVITLNEISFDEGVPGGDIGAYNTSDIFHELYCQAEPLFEMNDPTLIALSDSLVGELSNPIDKAKAIYDYVSENIEYLGQAVERGALWTYQNKEGDCSEFSDLMITLLRIQGIPARKCTGMILSNVTASGQALSNNNPIVGTEYGYYSNYLKNSQLSAGDLDSNALLHAWLEYYVPNLGWIPCDPTWGSAGFNYFNYMDFIHLTANIGAWFEVPSLSYNVSEYSVLPNPVFQSNAIFKYDTLINVKVLEVNLIEDNTMIYIIVGLILLITLLVIIYIFIKTGKNKKKKEAMYQNYSYPNNY